MHRVAELVEEDVPRKVRIEPGEPVPVKLTARERKLLTEFPVLPQKLTGRWKRVKGKRIYVGRFTLREVDAMLAPIAVLAEELKKIGGYEEFSQILERLVRVGETYDDGTRRRSGLDDPAEEAPRRGRNRTAPEPVGKGANKMPAPQVVDMSHFLDDKGAIANLPPAIRKRADYYGSIVAYTISLFSPHAEVPPVRCRRRPRYRPCEAILQVNPFMQGEDEVAWICPVCGDSGLIRGWLDTPWDVRGQVSASSHPGSTGRAAAPDDRGAGPVPGARLSPPAARRWSKIDPALRVRILNNVFCSTCSGNASMQLLEGRIEQGDLILKGRCVRCGGDVVRVVEGD